MVERSREWLQSFLKLGAFAGASVRPEDVQRQEDTVLRALDILDTRPGVVLADEVGMGKTYEALGIVAARLHAKPDARVLILTPGADLNTKWDKELRAFGDPGRPIYLPFRDGVAVAHTLGALVTTIRESRVVVAPINMFAGSRAWSEQAYLLEAWARAAGLAGTQTAAIFRRYREGKVERLDPTQGRFLDVLDWAELEPLLGPALAAHKASARASLFALLDQGYDAFADKRAVDASLSDLRFRLLSRLIPPLDLLVVDEAHKLKNPDSVRATGVRTVFDKKFDKALFLTATPFQLSVAELRQVFELFALVRSAPEDVLEQADGLLADVEEYQRAYAELERAWNALDEAGAADFEAWYREDSTLGRTPEDPNLAVTVGHARGLLRLKRERIEPGFRAWMIRSLREDKRQYRRTDRRPLVPKDGAAVPFLLYERFIAELFRSKSRTHKAAVQINMVSSFAAAREGALLTEEERAELEPEGEWYRRLLRRVLRPFEGAKRGHPKVDHVVADAVEAARAGDKTLIFCARVATLRQLKTEIEAQWNDHMMTLWRRVYPDAQESDIFDQRTDDDRVRGRHTLLQTRFQRNQDLLHLALRERYVSTVLEASDFAAENLDAILARANEILAKQRLAKTDAERLDWSTAKRCVEQATAQVMVEAGAAGDVDGQDLKRLLDERFVPLGFDLEKDELESYSEGTSVAQWRIDADDALPMIARNHLWSSLRGVLIHVPPDLRVRSVERIAAYLVSRYVPFLAELLGYARSEGVDVDAIESRALLPVVDRFWTTDAGRPWRDKVYRFLEYAGGLDHGRRREVLDDTKAGAIVRHTVDGETRERLREAFNTPLYPMVLVANEVMQEGLDLHHHCRRVIHHDLAWNPAQLEQRVGRVDRLGSLVQKLRVKKPGTTLDVAMPLVANTIDIRLDRAVRMRERWLEFLLGAVPNTEEYGLADEGAKALPEGLSRALKIELGPRVAPLAPSHRTSS